MLKRTLIGIGLFALIAGLVTGCGPGSDSLKADPIEVSGTVKFSDGKPVDGVQISFFVLSRGGSPANMPVTAGAFKGQLVPGDYSYFFVEGKKAGALKAIPPAYQENEADRKITVSSSSKSFDLTITK